MDHDQDPPQNPSDDYGYGSRPVAIGGGRGLLPESGEGLPGYEQALPGEPSDELGQPPTYIHDEKPVIEDPRGELLVGLAAALLAASTFLPWYRSFGEYDISGWASGTWGPVVFFLGLAGVAIIGLRRVGVAVAFPVSYSLLLEGIGWASVLGLLIKRFRTPETFDVVGVSTNPLKMGFWVALVAAVAIAMLASRLSRNAPIVVLPGWFHSKAGKLGAAVLALAIAGGAAFGLMNDAGEALAAARGDSGSFLGQDGSVQNGTQPDIEQGLPACVKDLGFTTPDGVTAIQGFSSEANGICLAQFTSEEPVAAVAKVFQDAMKRAGWTFEVVAATAGSKTARVFEVRAPKCGQVSIAEGVSEEDQRSVQVYLGGPEFCRTLQQQQQEQNPN